MDVYITRSYLNRLSLLCQVNFTTKSFVTATLLLWCVQFNEPNKFNLGWPFGYFYIAQSKPLTPWIINETRTKRISCGTSEPWRKIVFLRKVNKLTNYNLQQQNVTDVWIGRESSVWFDAQRSILGILRRHQENALLHTIASNVFSVETEAFSWLEKKWYGFNFWLACELISEITAVPRAKDMKLF